MSEWRSLHSILTEADQYFKEWYAAHDLLNEDDEEAELDPRYQRYSELMDIAGTMIGKNADPDALTEFKAGMSEIDLENLLDNWG